MAKMAMTFAWHHEKRMSEQKETQMEGGVALI